MLAYLTEKFRNIKTYFADQDTQQKINIITTVASEGFKVVMATLLAIFIPQECVNPETKVKRVCTFSDNFSDLSHYNSFVIAFNFVTLGIFVGLYVIEIKRENWLIKHLQFDSNYSDNHLLTHKGEYPKIFKRLTDFNREYAMSYSILKYIFIINFIFSAILVLHFYYMDYRTVTTLLTNTALCWSKVMTGSNLANESYKNEKAISYYNTKFIYFNTIDDEYLKNIKITNIEEPKQNNQYIEVNNIENNQKNEVNNTDNNTDNNLENNKKNEVNNLQNDINNDYKTDFNENIIKDIKIEIDEDEHKIKVIYEDISSNNPSNSDLSSLTNE